ncbi:MAG TPA: EpsI family protein [Phycisphaerae bacterium]|jgi:EpsI family protein|nr:EpsI family protein [Phycisphaerae bacterium]HOJ54657.1 EpsI family protein [Phycisphaerae bacterium]HOL27283.1 EpsI family protein [Phycisphaerae bacterium]HPP21084.1 EpsI family protein [Phycisphaerae bacterium]HPU33045.1 EpsI family protein [Phycisphaerae bacterium]
MRFAPPFSVAGVVAASVILLAGGVGQRWLEHRLAEADAAPVKLDRPLATLPLEIGSWRGVDLPMNQRLVDFAGCDDYINRRYRAEGSSESVELYVAYAARPARMLSHRPQVCYPAHGWTPRDVRRERIELPDGRGFDCLVQHFTRQQPDREAAIVLSYYVLRGKHVTDWTEFWGPKWRRPNLSRDPHFYVAQVQVSVTRKGASSLEGDEALLKDFTALVAPAIDALLPAPESSALE